MMMIFSAANAAAAATEPRLIQKSTILSGKHPSIQPPVANVIRNKKHIKRNREDL